MSPDAFVAVAADIGDRLCADAIWYENRCTWMGATVVGGPDAPPAYSTLDASLYAGTAGVALFLASLDRLGGNARARRTALGAIRHALAHAEKDGANERSLYSGSTGVALAAALVGESTGTAEPVERAAALIGSQGSSEEPDSGWDLLAGRAGVAVAFLRLHRLLDDPRLLVGARRVADELLAGARRTSAGWSWPAAGGDHRAHLTGFSHGAAGIGYALTELFAATGEPRYRDGAYRAFDFERSLFDHKAQNWPDLRRPSQGRRFASFWCHGAPGIALSRLRAFEVMRDDGLRDEAITALTTTRRVVEGAMRSVGWDFSLCHGLAGNAEIVLIGEEMLPEFTEGKGLAADVGRAGLVHTAKGTWPCGIAGRTPGLMLGLAGIGLFYLRLAHPGVPTVLLPSREPPGSSGAGPPPR